MNKTIIKCVCCIIVAIASITIASPCLSNPENHTTQITYLDEKRNEALGLVGAASVASVAISLIPGDTATPIADQLADMGSKFVIVIGAIYLEKYLTTLGPYIAFTWLIPAACICLMLYFLLKNKIFANITAKVGMLAIVLLLLVPTSIKISTLIDTTYSTSIEETIDTANSAANTIEENKDDESFLANIVDKVESTVSVSISTFENLLNDMIENFAVMVVTSCVIPVLVLFFLIWIIKLFISVDFTSAIDLKDVKKIRLKNKEIE